ncbi:MAG: FAD-dependent oxidoreductase, partial [Maritimibacter sp.]|nr:FAD-dependent oxidoreductase [Maritimibacter sp.]
MLDQTIPHTSEATETALRTYDLVVVGAGIAGLNALHAAAAYLPRGARVLLLDEKDRAGGMWNTAYDYVRLHQPHPMFTVGDMKWTWDKPATYLAGRDEIQAHLAAALGPIADKLALDLRLGHRVLSCDEVETGEGFRARVAFHPMDAPETFETVEATRAIYASGLDYRVPEPLPLTSDAVLSVTPQDLRAALSARPQAPVYVVGGGKTGMDTILEAWAQDPARKVTLIAGAGTNFMNRTRYAPTGLRRWTSGAPFSGLLRDIARSFDGDNEAAMIDHFRRTHATDPDTPNAGFLFGFQSEAEQASIAAGLTETLSDYLTDV